MLRPELNDVRSLLEAIGSGILYNLLTVASELHNIHNLRASPYVSTLVQGWPINTYPTYYIINSTITTLLYILTILLYSILYILLYTLLLFLVLSRTALSRRIKSSKSLFIQLLILFIIVFIRPINTIRKRQIIFS